jgi:hypothetical protein
VRFTGASQANLLQSGPTLHRLLRSARQDRKCCPPEDLSLYFISFCGGCGGISGGGSGGISGGTCGGGSSGGCSGGYTGGSRGGGSSTGRSNGSSTGGWGGCCWALVTIYLIVSAKGIEKTNNRSARDSRAELEGCQTSDPWSWGVSGPFMGPSRYVSGRFGVSGERGPRGDRRLKVAVGRDRRGKRSWCPCLYQAYRPVAAHLPARNVRHWRSGGCASDGRRVRSRAGGTEPCPLHTRPRAGNTWSISFCW